MANRFYSKFLESLGTADIDVTAVTWKVLLVTAAHTPSTGVHQFLSSIDAGHRLATSGAPSGVTWAAGVFDADDIVIPAVSPTQVSYVVLFVETGVAATSNLAVLWDGDNLPLTPDGGDVIVSFSDGPYKIFSIGA